MRKVFALACLVLALSLSAEGKKSYRGHQVISVKANSESQVKVLTQLQDENPDVLFLGDPSIVRSTEMVVPPNLMTEVLKLLKVAQFSVELLSADLQTEMDAVMEENERNVQLNNQTGFVSRNTQTKLQHNFYRRLEQVNDVMKQFAANYSDLVAMKRLSRRTHEYREVYYLELGTAGDNKSIIFLEGLAHAREWIVTASLLYVIDSILVRYTEDDPQATFALTQYTWVIIPVVNPDGYVYSWTNDRMWRKNRKVVSANCTGVDLNRNYDVDFGVTGVSSNCRDENYHGGSAFSEPESQNVAVLFGELKPRIVSFLSVHAYSQLLLYPWGYVPSFYDPSPPSNIERLKAMGRLMQNALAYNGKAYQLGTAYSVLGYAASGAAEDWALTEKENIFAYCYELRPDTMQAGGFDIPPSEIVPTGQELLASLSALAENMDKV